MSNSGGSKPPSAGSGGSPAGGAITPCSTHARLRVEEVSFSQNHVVEKDTTGNFSSPEWKRGRPASGNSPICYTRDRKIELTVKFKVTQKPCSKESVTIEGATTVGATNIEFKGTVDINPSDTETTVTLTSNLKLPNKVDCIDGFDITWSYNPASTGSLTAGDSSNVLYIVLADPSGTPVYWTLLDISCRGAAGKSTEKDFVEFSFKPFSSTIGDGKGFKRKRDNKELTYYKMGAGTPSSGVFTCADLLSRADGTARCGAWARFLVAMHQVHGITSSKVIGVVPIDASLLIVKNCTFVGSGSLPVPFTHKGKLECVKNDGIFGQGKNNPQFLFGDHALVEHSTGIYDPSYGAGPEPDLRKWEDKGIAGIGEMPPVSFTYDGDPHFISGICSPGFIKHTAIASDTLSSIATKYGIASAGSLYSHAYNAPLRALHSSPGSVSTGNIVFIPRDIASKVKILKIS